MAANIDEVISQCGQQIAELAYAATLPPSLTTQFQAWIPVVFGTPSPQATDGIFPPSANNDADPGQRVVTDWLATCQMALAILLEEGTGVSDPAPPGVDAAINAVVRTAYAVKFGALNGQITSAQQTAFVTAYNTYFT